MEKDVRTILHNEPLLFVHGPPVFIRVTVTDEESTSVFVPIEEEDRELSDTDEEKIQPIKLVKPAIAKKLLNLSGPFQRQVYRPLKFVIGDETLSGGIQKIDGEMIFIELDDEEDVIVGIEMSTIEEILWRGEPFEES